MPLAALLLVLGAAVCHSVWNLLVKSDARRLEIQSGALLVGVVLCSPALLIYPLTAVSPAAWGAVLVSGLFEAGYVFALTAAYGAGDLSLVYPVARGTPPLLVVPLAIVLLGERLAWQGLVGIGLVVLGIAAGHGGFPGGPAREVSVVVAAILGALVLRERHPAGRIAGAAVIFAGLVLIALAR